MIDARTMSTPSHIKLFNPGPVEVRQEILDAQAQWMIGHRGKDFESLFARIQQNLQKVFFTQQRVYLSTSSGTGLWEAAARNCVSDSPNGGVLATVCGDFSERWADVFERNGKATTVLSVERGQAITPELVAAAIQARSTPYEASTRISCSSSSSSSSSRPLTRPRSLLSSGCISTPPITPLPGLFRRPSSGCSPP